MIWTSNLKLKIFEHSKIACWNLKNSNHLLFLSWPSGYLLLFKNCFKHHRVSLQILSQLTSLFGFWCNCLNCKLWTVLYHVLHQILHRVLYQVLLLDSSSLLDHLESFEELLTERALSALFSPNLELSHSKVDFWGSLQVPLQVRLLHFGLNLPGFTRNSGPETVSSGQWSSLAEGLLNWFVWEFFGSKFSVQYFQYSTH